MEDYQERMIEEKIELDVKIAKLDSALNIKAPASATEVAIDHIELSMAEQIIMNQQLRRMKDYSNILAQRIGAFTTINYAKQK